MYKISININEKGKGFFALDLEDKTIGKMTVNLVGNELAVLDTIVGVKRLLHPVGSHLLQAVIEYARMHELKIITLSRFAQKQFSSNPIIYADVWEKA